MRVQATKSPGSFEVTTDGAGVVGHAGAALLRELADRLGLTKALGWHRAGGRRRHLDAAVLPSLFDGYPSLTSVFMRCGWRMLLMTQGALSSRENAAV